MNGDAQARTGTGAGRSGGGGAGGGAGAERSGGEGAGGGPTAERSGGGGAGTGPGAGQSGGEGAGTGPLTERNGGGAGGGPGAERNGGEGAGTGPLAEQGGGEGTGTGPLAEQGGGEGTGTGPLAEQGGGEGTGTGPGAGRDGGEGTGTGPGAGRDGGEGAGTGPGAGQSGGEGAGTGPGAGQSGGEGAGTGPGTERNRGEGAGGGAAGGTSGTRAGGRSGGGAVGGGGVGPRVLVNAQPFGFGPAAAAAVLADELAPHCDRLAYIGAGHTLDLQRRPPYTAVHDITGLPEPARLDRLRQLGEDYDLLLTAMDFPMAALARRAGLRVAVYDALTWYWPDLPAVVRDPSVLYLAQDFFGVRERVALETPSTGRAVVVAPLIAPGPPWRGGGGHVLVNLAGLHNPFWHPRETAAYARLMVAAVRAGTPAGLRVTVAASRLTAGELAGPAREPTGPTECGPGTTVGTYRRAEVLRLMSEAAYAFMTPGLGNVYDAAATGVPTVWLPPANNTQGLQSGLLHAHGCCDARMDWAGLGHAVDYRAPEAVAMAGLAAAVRETGDDRRLRDLLTGLVTTASAALDGTVPGLARALTDRFGHGGARDAAAEVVKWAARRGR
ncbi:hypothetical protein ELQ87_18075 [Streptomyces griseoviridis]|uniref:Glycosyltransferase n=1 Tax=Streptomyces griseoviridis TaxID=45398 RepID=A0A3Q9KU31_STRGD|nr:hypothetical protein [Streptomyces griseoviridis]AZS85977.1 hypothetical protein ELQ87_18075 [Streptomyces griseoviridis]QCN87164.1 hypothetical protein DDJ31_21205 [Streptomyces griseoviridis]